MSGNVHGSLSSGAGAVTFTGPGGTMPTYGGLIARDARGRTLLSRIELRRGKLLVRVGPDEDQHSPRAPRSRLLSREERACPAHRIRARTCQPDHGVYARRRRGAICPIRPLPSLVALPIRS